MATYTDLMSLFNDIGSAINDKGVNGQHYPYQMASAIRSISTGISVSGTYSVSSYGTFNVASYENISVPAGKIPLSAAIISSLANIYPIIGNGISSSITRGFITGYGNWSTIGAMILPSTSISTITPLSTSQVAVSQYTWTLNDVVVEAIPSSYIIPEGTYEITTNGTYDIKNFASVSVAIPVGATINNYTAGAVTPTEASQTISIPTGYTGLNAVTVNAISSNYVGTGVPIGSISTSTTSAAFTTFINAGYYSQNKQIGMAAQSITTPSITISNTTGLITGIASASTSAYYSVHSKTGTLQLTTQAAATIIPSTTAQTAVSAYRWTTGAVTVAAIPVSTLLSTAINGQSYLEATGDYGFRATVTIPEGWYSATEISKEFSSILPALSTQAKASQILAAYQVYDGDGKIVSGAMTNNGAYNGTLDSVTTSITIPSGYHNGSGVISHTTVAIPAPTMTFNSTTGVLTASGNWTRGFTTNSTYTSTYSFTIRSAANLTTSGSTVTVPAGYYATQATKNVASATHAAPALSLNSTTGVITATHTQTAGYVAAGTTSSTLTLTTQASTTIIPSTASQTAVAANRYTTGAVTVGPIPSTYKQLSSTTTATSESIVLGDTAYDNNGNLITGELEFITYYTGTTTPSNSLGSNGDIYLQS